VSLVAGIDYSTHAIDVVLIDEDTLKPEWHRFPITDDALTGTWIGNAFDRTRSVRQALASGYELWEQVLAVGIEEPRGISAGKLYRIQGAILTSIPYGLLVQPWIPSEWRKAVGLKGNASKVDIRDHFLKSLDGSPMSWPSVWDWPQDACDAYCIARATLQALERTTT
jgi:hypothetical protein